MKILKFINSFVNEAKHYKLEKINKSHLSNNELFIIIINIILIISLKSPISSHEIKFNKIKLCLNSEIIIKIKNSNSIEIINSEFFPKPDEVTLNGELYTLIDGNKVENLNDNINSISMKWNNQLNTCQNMFSSITCIEEIDLSNFNFSKISSTEKMFYQCVNLKYVYINNSIDTSTLITMNSMFYHAESLLFLDLSKFDTSPVINMDYLFAECHSLTSLNISSFVTSNCQSMKYLFSSCISLRTLDLSNFNTTLVKDMQGMFKNCQILQTLDLSNIKTNSVIDMQFMFNNCTSLLSLNLNSFDTSSVKIMKQMFSNCHSLTSIDIVNFDTKSVNNMQFMFYDCTSLKSLNLSNFDTSLVTDMQKMFSQCYSLTSLDLHNFNTSSVKKMKSMFNSCQSLSFLDISNFNTSLIDDASYMFNDCNSLTSLNLSSFDTSLVNNMNKMFCNCFSITSLNISNFDTSLVTNMVNMFDGCVSLLYLNLKNFTQNLSLINTNMFKNTYENIIYCLEDSINIDKIKALLIEKECSYNDCSNNWESNIYSIGNMENNIIIFDVKCNYSKIKDLNPDFIPLNKMNSNTYIYLYNINTNINELKESYYNFAFVDFTAENIDSLKKQFNIDEDIYILTSVYPSSDLRTATSDYNFKLLLKNGTELNLSFINSDFYFDIYVPITDLNLSNFNYAEYFLEQGFDIYDKYSNFYYDYCLSAYYKENDIIIKDRRNEIYPNNVTLCKSNCEYKNANIKEKRITCQCNLNINKYKSENDLNDDNNEKNENFLNADEENGNFGELLLNNINYKIFKCSYLILSFKNLKNNIGFYLISIIFLIIVIFNLKFAFFGLPNLRAKMFEETPTKEKIKNIILEQLSKRRDNKHISNANNSTRKKFKSITSISTKKNRITFFRTRNKIKNKKSKKKFSEDYLFSIDNKFIQKTNNEKSKNSINKNNENDNEEYNNLPYTKALLEDKRSAAQLFKSIIFQKVELIHLITTKTKIKDILICEYILSLLIDFFFNTFFYSDDAISDKYHNNGRLDFAITMIITISSNIATSIICYFLNHSDWIEDKIEDILEIRIEYRYLLIFNIFLKILKN